MCCALLPLPKPAFTPFLPVRPSPWISTVVPLHSRRPLVRYRSPRKSTRRVTMILDDLSEKMSDALRKMRGMSKLTDKNIATAMKQVKRALLDADVNLRVVSDLLKQVKSRAIGASVPDGVEPGQLLIKIMQEELADIMGKDQAPLAKRDDDQPTVVLLAGLQGAGKTTAAAKLALWCLNEGRTVMMIAADVYRPAAVEQLKRLGETVGVDVFEMGTQTNPVQIVNQGISRAKEMGVGTVIVDTAGRQVVDGKLMTELKDMKKACAADETLLVVDAMTGQEAANLTRAFNDEVGITGAILTKMDGDTRGGAALSVVRVSGAPIKFLGVGEKVERLEAFYPERMASRILGMGDVVSLVERAQEAMDIKDAEKMTKKMMESKFDFDDFLKQTRLISKMGSLGGVMKMLPGMGGQVSDSKLAEAEAKLKVADSLIKSMTKQERANPELLYSAPSAFSRMERIAGGSGRTMADAQNLMSDFQKLRTMMQRMSKQIAGGPGGAPAEGVGGTPNRAQRRRAARKKALRGGSRRGFG